MSMPSPVAGNDAVSGFPAGTGAQWFTSLSISNANEDNSGTMSVETLTALTTFYGCIGTGCFVFGLLLNALVFSYFYSRRSTLSNTMYCVIVSVDLLISALILPYILPHFKSRDPVIFKSMGFCKFWTVVWGVASKTSVVLVGVLGIYRTVLLVNPLNTTARTLIKRVVLGGILVYCVVLTICETLPMWYPQFLWYFDQLRMRCEWHDPAGCVDKSRCERIRTFGYIWSSVTLALPVLPMLGSAVLSVYGLKKSTNIGKKSGSKRNANSYASMTVVLFTLLYVVLNIPTLVYWILMLIHYAAGYNTTLLNFDHPYYFYFNFVEVLTVSLNSVFNPCLYLIRMRDLRRHLANSLLAYRKEGKFSRVSTGHAPSQSKSTAMATKSSTLTDCQQAAPTSVREKGEQAQSAASGSGRDIVMVNMNAGNVYNQEV